MFSKTATETIRETARENGLDPALLLALAHVESGGRTHATVDGRAEPLIRFEGHYFDRRLDGARRAAARAAGLADPRPGAVANPRRQAERWALLARAAAIDRAAAYESVSWGVGQVMGAHWRRLGFSDVEALVAEARAGLAGQLRLMLGYIEAAGLKEALRAHEWARFARGYNGPAYARNRYDTKLARAFARYSAGGRAADARKARLAIGARGAAVASLQAMLRALGYPLAADGIFGPKTARAVERFQADHGLRVDGVAGPATRAALERGLPFAGLRARWRRLLSWLRERLRGAR